MTLCHINSFTVTMSELPNRIIVVATENPELSFLFHVASEKCDDVIAKVYHNRSLPPVPDGVESHPCTKCIVYGTSINSSVLQDALAGTDCDSIDSDSDSVHGEYTSECVMCNHDAIEWTPCEIAVSTIVEILKDGPEGQSTPLIHHYSIDPVVVPLATLIGTVVFESSE